MSTRKRKRATAKEDTTSSRNKAVCVEQNTPLKRSTPEHYPDGTPLLFYRVDSNTYTKLHPDEEHASTTIVPDSHRCPIDWTFLLAHDTVLHVHPDHHCANASGLAQQGSSWKSAHWTASLDERMSEIGTDRFPKGGSQGGGSPPWWDDQQWARFRTVCVGGGHLGDLLDQVTQRPLAAWREFVCFRAASGISDLVRTAAFLADSAVESVYVNINATLCDEGESLLRLVQAVETRANLITLVLSVHAEPTPMVVDAFLRLQAALVRHRRSRLLHVLPLPPSVACIVVEYVHSCLPSRIIDSLVQANRFRNLRMLFHSAAHRDGEDALHVHPVWYEASEEEAWRLFINAGALRWHRLTRQVFRL
jgi:hypothetical protein